MIRELPVTGVSAHHSVRAEDLAEIGTVEVEEKLDGRIMTMMFSPAKKKAEKPAAESKAAEDSKVAEESTAGDESKTA